MRRAWCVTAGVGLTINPINLVGGMFPPTPSDAEACCLIRDVGDREIPA